MDGMFGNVLKAWVVGAMGVAAFASAACAANSGVFEASPAKLQAHMEYLASDQLAGREAGTPGYDLAAAYVAGQFEDMGLQPLGDDGTYLQAVTLIQHRPGQQGSIRIRYSSDRATDLILGEDFKPSSVPHGGDIRLDAPAVFAGFGVVAPNVYHDDFAGLDVRGKIVVVLEGAPALISPADRSFVASARSKALMAY